MPFSHVKASHADKLEELSALLVRSNRVVVVTGAGISTSCGVPDFRSSDGLYSLMKASHDKSSPSKQRQVKGEDLFNVNLFRDEHQTATFYKFIAGLREKCIATPRTSMAHKLIKKLRDQQKLVRCYTQNIDGFESREQLCQDLGRGPGNRHRLAKKVLNTVRSTTSSLPGGVHDAGCEAVPLHGGLDNLRCTVCSHVQDWTADAQATFLGGTAPVCPECETTDMVRRAVGKRGVRSGHLRPNVVLYGEEHPNTEAISRVRCNDLNMKPDLLLVMGTSLKVDGLKMLVKEFAQAVHSHRNGKVVFVNLTQPAASTWGDVIDVWVDMSCDSWVRDMKKRRKELWQTQALIDETTISTSKTSSSSQQSVKRKRQDVEDESISKAHETPRKRQKADALGGSPGDNVKVVVPNDPAALRKLQAKCQKTAGRAAGRAAALLKSDPTKLKRRTEASRHPKESPTSSPFNISSQDDLLHDTIIVNSSPSFPSSPPLSDENTLLDFPPSSPSPSPASLSSPTRQLQEFRFNTQHRSQARISSHRKSQITRLRRRASIAVHVDPVVVEDHEMYSNQPSANESSQQDGSTNNNVSPEEEKEGGGVLREKPNNLNSCVSRRSPRSFATGSKIRSLSDTATMGVSGFGKESRADVIGVFNVPSLVGQENA